MKNTTWKTRTPDEILSDFEKAVENILNSKVTPRAKIYSNEELLKISKDYIDNYDENAFENTELGRALNTRFKPLPYKMILLTNPTKDENFEKHNIYKFSK